MRTIRIEIPVPEFRLPAFIRNLFRREDPEDLDPGRLLVGQRIFVVGEALRFQHEIALGSPDTNDGEVLAGTFAKLAENKIDTGVGVTLVRDDFLLRVIDLPPVQPTKVRDIVRFEARQNIPFVLEDVEWRWTLSADERQAEAEGREYLLDARVYLAMMRRDRILHFRDVVNGVDHKLGQSVDLIQSSESTWVNYVSLFPEKEFLLIVDLQEFFTLVTVTDGDGVWGKRISIGKLSIENGGDEVLREFVFEIQRCCIFYTQHRRVSLQGVCFGGLTTDIPDLQEKISKKISLPKRELLLPSCVEFSTAEQSGSSVPSLMLAVATALQRLGYGRFRWNFMPNGVPIPPKLEHAWGLVVDSQGITAVKVGVKA